MFSGFGGLDSRYAAIPQTFEDFYRCYPISMMNDRIRKDDANYGGKIFLPPSTLGKLTMLNIRYPMLFRLAANESGLVTHGGVLEFIAEEGRVYLPQWMMETLKVTPGSLLKIASADVPLGKFVKIEPQSVDFLDITDPKAVLENVLRNFSTLTVNDIIEISYNSKKYRIKILEVEPESDFNSICVIETDLVTDFAPPVGYVEPDYEALKKEQKEKRAQQRADRTFDPSRYTKGSMSARLNYDGLLKESAQKNTPFLGAGNKLSGKPTNDSIASTDLQSLDFDTDGEPARLDLPEGQLFFGFPLVLPRKESTNDDPQQKVFKGEGQSLRKSNKSKKPKK